MEREKRGCLTVKGRKFYVYDGLNTIGRDKQATVIVKDLGVSHQQAILTIVDETRHFISDFNSSNGTHINNERLVPYKLYEIDDGSVIFFSVDVEATYKKISNSELSDTEEVPLQDTQIDDSCFVENTQFIDITSTFEGKVSKPEYVIPDDGFDFNSIITQNLIKRDANEKSESELGETAADSRGISNASSAHFKDNLPRLNCSLTDADATSSEDVARKGATEISSTEFENSAKLASTDYKPTEVNLSISNEVSNQIKVPKVKEPNSEQSINLQNLNSEEMVLPDNSSLNNYQINKSDNSVTLLCNKDLSIMSNNQENNSNLSIVSDNSALNNSQKINSDPEIVSHENNPNPPIVSDNVALPDVQERKSNPATVSDNTTLSVDQKHKPNPDQSALTDKTELFYNNENGFKYTIPDDGYDFNSVEPTQKLVSTVNRVSSSFPLSTPVITDEVHEQNVQSRIIDSKGIPKNDENVTTDDLNEEINVKNDQQEKFNHSAGIIPDDFKSDIIKDSKSDTANDSTNTKAEKDSLSLEKVKEGHRHDVQTQLGSPKTKLSDASGLKEHHGIDDLPKTPSSEEEDDIYDLPTQVLQPKSPKASNEQQEHDDIYDLPAQLLPKSKVSNEANPLNNVQVQLTQPLPKVDLVYSSNPTDLVEETVDSPKQISQETGNYSSKDLKDIPPPQSLSAEIAANSGAGELKDISNKPPENEVQVPPKPGLANHVIMEAHDIPTNILTESNNCNSEEDISEAPSRDDVLKTDIANDDGSLKVRNLGKVINKDQDVPTDALTKLNDSDIEELKDDEDNVLDISSTVVEKTKDEAKTLTCEHSRELNSIDGGDINDHKSGSLDENVTNNYKVKTQTMDSAGHELTDKSDLSDKSKSEGPVKDSDNKQAKISSEAIDFNSEDLKDDQNDCKTYLSTNDDSGQIQDSIDCNSEDLKVICTTKHDSTKADDKDDCKTPLSTTDDSGQVKDSTAQATNSNREGLLPEKLKLDLANAENVIHDLLTESDCERIVLKINKVNFDVLNMQTQTENSNSEVGKDINDENVLLPKPENSKNTIENIPMYDSEEAKEIPQALTETAEDVNDKSDDLIRENINDDDSEKSSQELLQAKGSDSKELNDLNNKPIRFENCDSEEPTNIPLPHSLTKTKAGDVNDKSDVENIDETIDSTKEEDCHKRTEESNNCDSVEPTNIPLSRSVTRAKVGDVNDKSDVESIDEVIVLIKVEDNPIKTEKSKNCDFEEAKVIPHTLRSTSSKTGDVDDLASENIDEAIQKESSQQSEELKEVDHKLTITVVDKLKDLKSEYISVDVLKTLTPASKSDLAELKGSNQKSNAVVVKDYKSILLDELSPEEPTGSSQSVLTKEGEPIGDSVDIQNSSSVEVPQDCSSKSPSLFKLGDVIPKTPSSVANHLDDSQSASEANPKTKINQDAESNLEVSQSLKTSFDTVVAQEGDIEIESSSSSKTASSKPLQLDNTTDMVKTENASQCLKTSFDIVVTQEGDVEIESSSSSKTASSKPLQLDMAQSDLAKIPVFENTKSDNTSLEHTSDNINSSPNDTAELKTSSEFVHVGDDENIKPIILGKDNSISEAVPQDSEVIQLDVETSQGENIVLDQGTSIPLKAVDDVTSDDIPLGVGTASALLEHPEILPLHEQPPTLLDTVVEPISDDEAEDSSKSREDIPLKDVVDTNDTVAKTNSVENAHTLLKDIPDSQETLDEGNTEEIELVSLEFREEVTLNQDASFESADESRDVISLCKANVGLLKPTAEVNFVKTANISLKSCNEVLDEDNSGSAESVGEVNSDSTAPVLLEPSNEVYIDVETEDEANSEQTSVSLEPYDDLKHSHVPHEALVEVKLDKNASISSETRSSREDGKDALVSLEGPSISPEIMGEAISGRTVIPLESCENQVVHKIVDESRSNDMRETVEVKSHETTCVSSVSSEEVLLKGNTKVSAKTYAETNIEETAIASLESRDIVPVVEDDIAMLETRSETPLDETHEDVRVLHETNTVTSLKPLGEIPLDKDTKISCKTPDDVDSEENPQTREDVIKDKDILIHETIAKANTDKVVPVTSKSPEEVSAFDDKRVLLKTISVKFPGEGNSPKHIPSEKDIPITFEANSSDGALHISESSKEVALDVGTTAASLKHVEDNSDETSVVSLESSEEVSTGENKPDVVETSQSCEKLPSDGNTSVDEANSDEIIFASCASSETPKKDTRVSSEFDDETCRNSMESPILILLDIEANSNRTDLASTTSNDKCLDISPTPSYADASLKPPVESNTPVSTETNSVDEANLIKTSIISLPSNEEGHADDATSVSLQPANNSGASSEAYPLKSSEEKSHVMEDDPSSSYETARETLEVPSGNLVQVSSKSGDEDNSDETALTSLASSDGDAPALNLHGGEANSYTAVDKSISNDDNSTGNSDKGAFVSLQSRIEAISLRNFLVSSNTCNQVPLDVDTTADFDETTRVSSEITNAAPLGEDAAATSDRTVSVILKSCNETPSNEDTPILIESGDEDIISIESHDEVCNETSSNEDTPILLESGDEDIISIESHDEASVDVVIGPSSDKAKTNITTIPQEKYEAATHVSPDPNNEPNSNDETPALLKHDVSAPRNEVISDDLSVVSVESRDKSVRVSLQSDNEGKSEEACSVLESQDESSLHEPNDEVNEDTVTPVSLESGSKVSLKDTPVVTDPSDKTNSDITVEVSLQPVGEANSDRTHKAIPEDNSEKDTSLVVVDVHEATFVSFNVSSDKAGGKVEAVRVDTCGNVSPEHVDEDKHKSHESLDKSSGGNTNASFEELVESNPDRIDTASYESCDASPSDGDDLLVVDVESYTDKTDYNSEVPLDETTALEGNLDETSLVSEVRNKSCDVSPSDGVVLIEVGVESNTDKTDLRSEVPLDDTTVTEGNPDETSVVSEVHEESYNVSPTDGDVLLEIDVETNADETDLNSEVPLGETTVTESNSDETSLVSKVHKESCNVSPTDGDVLLEIDVETNTDETDLNGEVPLGEPTAMQGNSDEISLASEARNEISSDEHISVSFPPKGEASLQSTDPREGVPLDENTSNSTKRADEGNATKCDEAPNVSLTSDHEVNLDVIIDISSDSCQEDPSDETAVEAISFAALTDASTHVSHQYGDKGKTETVSPDSHDEVSLSKQTLGDNSLRELVDETPVGSSSQISREPGNNGSLDENSLDKNVPTEDANDKNSDWMKMKDEDNSSKTTPPFQRDDNFVALEPSTKGNLDRAKLATLPSRDDSLDINTSGVPKTGNGANLVSLESQDEETVESAHGLNNLVSLGCRHEVLDELASDKTTLVSFKPQHETFESISDDQTSISDNIDVEANSPKLLEFESDTSLDNPNIVSFEIASDQIDIPPETSNETNSATPSLTYAESCDEASSAKGADVLRKANSDVSTLTSAEATIVSFEPRNEDDKGVLVSRQPSDEATSNKITLPSLKTNDDDDAIETSRGETSANDNFNKDTVTLEPQDDEANRNKIIPLTLEANSEASSLVSLEANSRRNEVEADVVSPRIVETSVQKDTLILVESPHPHEETTVVSLDPTDEANSSRTTCVHLELDDEVAHASRESGNETNSKETSGVLDTIVSVSIESDDDDKSETCSQTIALESKADNTNSGSPPESNNDVDICSNNIISASKSCSSTSNDKDLSSVVSLETDENTIAECVNLTYSSQVSSDSISRRDLSCDATFSDRSSSGIINLSLAINDEIASLKIHNEVKPEMVHLSSSLESCFDEDASLQIDSDDNSPTANPSSSSSDKVSSLETDSMLNSGRPNLSSTPKLEDKSDLGRIVPSSLPKSGESKANSEGPKSKEDNFKEANLPSSSVSCSDDVLSLDANNDSDSKRVNLSLPLESCSDKVSLLETVNEANTEATDLSSKSEKDTSQETDNEISTGRSNLCSSPESCSNNVPSLETDIEVNSVRANLTTSSESCPDEVPSIETDSDDKLSPSLESCSNKVPLESANKANSEVTNLSSCSYKVEADDKANLEEINLSTTPESHSTNNVDNLELCSDNVPSPQTSNEVNSSSPKSSSSNNVLSLETDDKSNSRSTNPTLASDSCSDNKVHSMETANEVNSLSSESCSSNNVCSLETNSRITNRTPASESWSDNKLQSLETANEVNSLPSESCSSNNVCSLETNSRSTNRTRASELCSDNNVHSLETANEVNSLSQESSSDNVPLLETENEGNVNEIPSVSLEIDVDTERSNVPSSSESCEAICSDKIASISLKTDDDTNSERGSFASTSKSRSDEIAPTSLETDVEGEKSVEYKATVSLNSDAEAKSTSSSESCVAIISDDEVNTDRMKSCEATNAFEANTDRSNISSSESCDAVSSNLIVTDDETNVRKSKPSELCDETRSGKIFDEVDAETNSSKASNTSVGTISISSKTLGKVNERTNISSSSESSCFDRVASVSLETGNEASASLETDIIDSVTLKTDDNTISGRASFTSSRKTCEPTPSTEDDEISTGRAKAVVDHDKTADVSTIIEVEVVSSPESDSDKVARVYGEATEREVCLDNTASVSIKNDDDDSEKAKLVSLSETCDKTSVSLEIDEESNSAEENRTSLSEVDDKADLGEGSLASTSETDDKAKLEGENADTDIDNKTNLVRKEICDEAKLKGEDRVSSTNIEDSEGEKVSVPPESDDKVNLGEKELDEAILEEEKPALSSNICDQAKHDDGRANLEGENVDDIASPGNNKKANLEKEKGTSSPTTVDKANLEGEKLASMPELFVNKSNLMGERLASPLEVDGEANLEEQNRVSSLETDQRGNLGREILTTPSENDDTANLKGETSKLQVEQSASSSGVAAGLTGEKLVSSSETEGKVILRGETATSLLEIDQKTKLEGGSLASSSEFERKGKNLASLSKIKDLAGENFNEAKEPVETADLEEEKRDVSLKTDGKDNLEVKLVSTSDSDEELVIIEETEIKDPEMRLRKLDSLVQTEIDDERKTGKSESSLTAELNKDTEGVSKRKASLAFRDDDENGTTCKRSNKNLGLINNDSENSEKQSSVNVNESNIKVEDRNSNISTETHVELTSTNLTKASNKVENIILPSKLKVSEQFTKEKVDVNLESNALSLIRNAYCGSESEDDDADDPNMEVKQKKHIPSSESSSVVLKNAEITKPMTSSNNKTTEVVVSVAQNQGIDLLSKKSGSYLGVGTQNLKLSTQENNFKNDTKVTNNILASELITTVGNISKPSSTSEVFKFNNIEDDVDKGTSTVIILNQSCTNNKVDDISFEPKVNTEVYESNETPRESVGKIVIECEHELQYPNIKSTCTTESGGSTVFEKSAQISRGDLNDTNTNSILQNTQMDDNFYAASTQIFNDATFSTNKTPANKDDSIFVIPDDGFDFNIVNTQKLKDLQRVPSTSTKTTSDFHDLPTQLKSGKGTSTIHDLPTQLKSSQNTSSPNSPNTSSIHDLPTQLKTSAGTIHDLPTQLKTSVQNIPSTSTIHDLPTQLKTTVNQNQDLPSHLENSQASSENTQTNPLDIHDMPTQIMDTEQSSETSNENTQVNPLDVHCMATQIMDSQTSNENTQVDVHSMATQLIVPARDSRSVQEIEELEISVYDAETQLLPISINQDNNTVSNEEPTASENNEEQKSPNVGAEKEDDDATQEYQIENLQINEASSDSNNTHVDEVAEPTSSIPANIGSEKLITSETIPTTLPDSDNESQLPMHLLKKRTTKRLTSNDIESISSNDGDNIRIEQADSPKCDSNSTMDSEGVSQLHTRQLKRRVQNKIVSDDDTQIDDSSNDSVNFLATAHSTLASHSDSDTQSQLPMHLLKRRTTKPLESQDILGNEESNQATTTNLEDKESYTKKNEITVLDENQPKTIEMDAKINAKTTDNESDSHTYIEAVESTEESNPQVNLLKNKPSTSIVDDGGCSSSDFEDDSKRSERKKPMKTRKERDIDKNITPRTYSRLKSSNKTTSSIAKNSDSDSDIETTPKTNTDKSSIIAEDSDSNTDVDGNVNHNKSTSILSATDIEDSFVKRRSFLDVSNDVIPATQEMADTSKVPFTRDLSTVLDATNDEMSGNTKDNTCSEVSFKLGLTQEEEEIRKNDVYVVQDLADDSADSFDFGRPTQKVDTANDDDDDFAGSTQKVTNKGKSRTEKVAEDDIFDNQTQKVDSEVFKRPLERPSILKNSFRLETSCADLDDSDLFIASTQVMDADNSKRRGNTQENLDDSDVFIAATQKVESGPSARNVNDSDIFYAATQKVDFNGSSESSLDKSKKLDEALFSAATQRMDFVKSVPTTNSKNVDDDDDDNNDSIFFAATQVSEAPPPRNISTQDTVTVADSDSFNLGDDEHVKVMELNISTLSDSSEERRKKVSFGRVQEIETLPVANVATSATETVNKDIEDTVNKNKDIESRNAECVPVADKNDIESIPKIDSIKKNTNIDEDLNKKSDIESVTVNKNKDIESQMEVMFATQTIHLTESDPTRPNNPIEKTLLECSTQDVMNTLTNEEKVTKAAPRRSRRNSKNLEELDEPLKKRRTRKQSTDKKETEVSSSNNTSSALKTIPEVVKPTLSPRRSKFATIQSGVDEEKEDDSNIDEFQNDLPVETNLEKEKTDETLPQCSKSLVMEEPIPIVENRRPIRERKKKYESLDEEYFSMPIKKRQMRFDDMRWDDLYTEKPAARKRASRKKEETGEGKPTRGRATRGNKKVNTTEVSDEVKAQAQQSTTSSEDTETLPPPPPVVPSKEKGSRKSRADRISKKRKSSDSDDDCLITISVPKKQKHITISDDSSDDKVQAQLDVSTKRGVKMEAPSTSLISTPERAKRKLKPKVVFTMFDSLELSSLVRALGGVMVDSIDMSTVLVTKNILRSQKLLCAVGQCKPICSPNWLLECKKAHTFLDPWDFLIEDKEAEKKWNFSIKESYNRSKCRKLFEGYSFHVVATRAIDVIKAAIESSGGKCVSKMPKAGNFIVVAAEENRGKCAKYFKQNVKVVLPEAIFDGVLRQDIVFDKHMLT